MRVFTDGACSGNPGPGGWAWVTDDGRQGSGGEAPTTNQRMELTAVLEALRALEGAVEVHSDSTYVVNCFRDKWYEGWLARDWKTSQRKPVANRDLWQPLVDRVLARPGEISFTWVKGHAGNRMNELADSLAVEAMVRHRDRLGPVPGRGAGEHSAEEGLELLDRAVAGGGIAPPWPVERAVVVTGVRKLSGDHEVELEGAVAGLDPANDIVVSGLRLGAELEGAELARRARIPVAVVLPFADPARAWGPADRRRFDEALAAAHWVVTLEGDPTQPGAAIRDRNRWLWAAAVGAVVVGDPELAEEAELSGLGVIEI